MIKKNELFSYDKYLQGKNQELLEREEKIKKQYQKFQKFEKIKHNEGLKKEYEDKLKDVKLLELTLRKKKH